MADIPDGADIHVARFAVAWEITKKSFSGCQFIGNEKENLKRIVNVYIKALNAIVEEKEIQNQ